MARRSPRKKPISPEAVESDNDGFVAVASDDQYVAYVFHSLYPYMPSPSERTAHHPWQLNQRRTMTSRLPPLFFPQ